MAAEWPCTCLPDLFDTPCEGCQRNAVAALLTPVPDVSEREECQWKQLPGTPFVVPRRNGIEPVPVGTYVVMVFRVTGYDKDCDGSLMARLENVDRHGEETGFETTNIGLAPDSELIVEHPSKLWPK
jgi:hypothetical protein